MPNYLGLTDSFGISYDSVGILLCTGIQSAKIAEQYQRIYRVFWSGVKVPKNFRGRIPIPTDLQLKIDRLLLAWDIRHQRRRIDFGVPPEVVKSRHLPIRAAKNCPSSASMLEALSSSRSHTDFLKKILEEYACVVNTFDMSKQEDVSVIENRGKFKAHIFEKILPELKSFNIVSKLKRGSLFTKFELWKRKLYEIKTKAKN